MSASGSASVSAAAPGSQPSGGPGAIAAIKANWAKFFDVSTPVAERVALLQNGQQFTSILSAQASSAADRTTTEQVTAVTSIGAGQAAVSYNVLVSGKVVPALAGIGGTSVYEGGTWKVSSSDLCNLLTYESNGKTYPGC